jgi:thiol-disulfide isomerase/thioredoxin
MKRNILKILLLLFFAAASLMRLQAIEIYNFRDLEPLLNKDNDTTYIIHFWATWCVPCIKELPAFDKIAGTYAGQKVKIILVSLDFVRQIDDRLIPFIKNNSIKSEVIVLDDPNQNYWINKVNPDWTGSIPATLIYKGESRMFFERSLTYKEIIEFMNLKN